MTGVPRDRFLHKTILMITMAISVMAAMTAITIHNVFSSEVKLFPPLSKNNQDLRLCSHCLFPVVVSSLEQAVHNL
jgi:hypothetical protein